MLDEYRFVLLFVDRNGAHYFYDRRRKEVRFSPNALGPASGVEAYSVPGALKDMAPGFQDFRLTEGGLEFKDLKALREGAQIWMERMEGFETKLDRGAKNVGNLDILFEKLSSILPPEVIGEVFTQLARRQQEPEA